MSTTHSQRSARVGDIDWHIRELGHRTTGTPSIIFVAGLGSGEYLLPHADLLAKSRHVLVPDMPGFGDTVGPRRLRTVEEFGDSLIEFITAVTTAPVDLVGNSFGTQIVLAAAARRPELISRIVLIGPTFDAAARDLPTAFGRWLRIAPLEPPALALSLLRSYLKSGVRTPWLALRAGLRDQPEEHLAALPHRVLLIRGENDHLAPIGWLRELERRARHAEVAEVAGAAHTVDFAAPLQAAALTRRFLDPGRTE